MPSTSDNARPRGPRSNARTGAGNGRSNGNPSSARPRYRIRWKKETEVSCCVKYTVFGFNVLFWLIGMGIFIIGIWAQIVKNPYSQLTQSHRFYLDPAWLLVIVGFLIFIIGFSGCIGALRENTCFLAFYSTLLGVILLAELAFAVLAFVAKDWLKKEIERELDKMIVSYRDDPDLQGVIDWIQRDWLKCCGIAGPDDWDKNIYFDKASVKYNSTEAGGVPFSCCIDQPQENLKNYFCGHGVRLQNYHGSTNFYETGCLPKLVVWLNKNVQSVGIALMIIAIIQDALCGRRIHCEGCLAKSDVWFERNHAHVLGLTLATVVVNILGICFAQNLRSDIFAQQARWYYER